MENKKSDRRSNRTRQCLRNALIELILEKHYDDITVQNILDRADDGLTPLKADFDRQRQRGLYHTLTSIAAVKSILSDGATFSLCLCFTHGGMSLMWSIELISLETK